MTKTNTLNRPVPLFFLVLLFISCLFLTGSLSYGERSAQDIIKDIESKRLDWNKNRTPGSIQRLKKIYKDIPGVDFCRGRMKLDLYLTFLHLADLNKDGEPDVIHDGYCRPYPHVQIWLREPTGYVSHYKYAGYIIWIKQTKNGTKLAIKTDAVGCDSDDSIQYLEINKWEGTTISKNRLAFPSSTQIPAVMYEKKCKLKTARGLLRTNPVVNNKVEKWECSPDLYVKGNVISEYPRGTKGTVWAEAVDGNNKKWFFLLVKAETNINDNSIYYMIGNHTLSIGWIEADAIEIE